MAKLEEVREALINEELKKTKLEEELGVLSSKEDSLNSKANYFNLYSNL
jgi:hypothetical protein